ncbi:MAG TPA: Rieske 2Fe-2S domain-containing protein [Bryobacteraceae bacterium]|jgi:nitrite reductase (NADH) small subunit|nr:Rieske 2Fe-2S domain-containing protein [Bryobacteraceae bacterium]
MTKVIRDTVVAHLNAIPPGEGRNFTVRGVQLAIFHARSGQVFATQASCPHKTGPLADGLVGGDVLVCPLHSWKFDLRSGDAILGECGIKTYPARLDPEGRIVITLDPLEGND